MHSDREAAGVIVALLARNGVRELFNMPGDAFPVLEAIARAEAAGTPAPRIVTCLHETVALAAAHGHHMVSRIPQACLFHVDVGLQM
ncbi:thiamine pyrophosphate-binding protein, partial [Clostridium perfringens]